VAHQHESSVSFAEYTPSRVRSSSRSPHSLLTFHDLFLLRHEQLYRTDTPASWSSSWRSSSSIPYVPSNTPSYVFQSRSPHSLLACHFLFLLRHKPSYRTGAPTGAKNEGTTVAPTEQTPEPDARSFFAQNLHCLTFRFRNY